VSPACALDTQKRWRVSSPRIYRCETRLISAGDTFSTRLTVNPPDALTILSASYQHSKKLLAVQATSSRAGAVLMVYMTSTGQFIGPLRPSTTTAGAYAGQFPMQNNPKSIIVNGSLGAAPSRA